eukprot:scaffold126770_cov21-Tisochrysis_lutea.AAC.1
MGRPPRIRAPRPPSKPWKRSPHNSPKQCPMHWPSWRSRMTRCTRWVGGLCVVHEGTSAVRNAVDAKLERCQMTSCADEHGLCGGCKVIQLCCMHWVEQEVLDNQRYADFTFWTELYAASKEMSWTTRLTHRSKQNLAANEIQKEIDDLGSVPFCSGTHIGPLHKLHDGVLMAGKANVLAMSASFSRIRISYSLNFLVRALLKSEVLCLIVTQP